MKEEEERKKKRAVCVCVEAKTVLNKTATQKETSKQKHLKQTID